jgi:glutaminyl-tRNA synthetase
VKGKTPMDDKLSKDKESINNTELGDNEIVSSNFIWDFIDDDIKEGKAENIHTRFPPEPNGYLHIGHAKAICINFGTSAKYNGKCNLRFDDTNPSKEDVEYVDSIKEDVSWLGFEWDGLYYASDYFETMYECAETLIKKGLAFVCDLNADEIREYRGTLTKPGKDSPYRDRTVEENMDIFRAMRTGRYDDGSKVLRAKIDMASPNMNMRDPVLYRILRATHHRTGDTWCIYPMYDYAHPIEDMIENISHSLCSIEFEDHRPLYDWVVNNVGLDAKPRQIEFARLNMTYTVMSKRKLLTLVDEGIVNGWDDPRLPTISGLRRRGYTPSSIRDFCDRIGVAKTTSIVDVALLEHCIREDLNKSAPRVMAVLRPLKLIIDNYPENVTEEFDIENNPEEPDSGTRKVVFSRELYIERDDFMENPPGKYFRLSPGREVRLKQTYFVKCTDIVKNEKTGEVIEVHCTYDPASKGGNSPDGRKVKGTIHWVSAHNAIDAEVRLYDRLFTVENPGDENEDANYIDYINPESFERLTECKVEPGLKNAEKGSKFQFMRIGYFCVESVDSGNGKLIFNRTVSLKDSWAKMQK